VICKLWAIAALPISLGKGKRKRLIYGRKFHSCPEFKLRSMNG